MMANGFIEKLRGARKIEVFAAIVVIALLALQWMNTAAISPSGEKSELEVRLESILTQIEGAGRVDAMITQQENGVVTGALIVAEGADDIKTYLNLQNAVKTLLNIDLSQIRIINRAKKYGG